MLTLARTPEVGGLSRLTRLCVHWEGLVGHPGFKGSEEANEEGFELLATPYTTAFQGPMAAHPSPSTREPGSRCEERCPGDYVGLEWKWQLTGTGQGQPGRDVCREGKGCTAAWGAGLGVPCPCDGDRQYLHPNVRDSVVTDTADDAV